MKALLLALTAATAFALSSSAATLIDYNMGTTSFTSIGLYAGGTSPVGTVIPGANGTSTITPVNYTASSLSTGLLYGVGSSGYGGRALFFSTYASATGTSNEFSQPTEADAVTGQDYLAFSITPSAGYALNLSTLTFQYERDSTVTPGVTSAASNWFLMSSADNFTTKITGGALTAIQTANSFATVTATLSGLPSFQNVTAATTFELYFYGASPTGNEAIRLDEFTLTGTVVALAVPEAPTWAAALLGLVSLLLVLRRRQVVAL